MAELIRREKDGFIYYTSAQLEAFREVRHGFFTRAGGVSEGIYSSLNFRFSCEDSYENVVTNHVLAGQMLGAEPQNIVCTVQKHTDNVRVLKGEYTSEGEGEPVDALVTDIKGLCLVAYFADCQPLLMFHRKKGVCAVVHAGWRGVANGIVTKTVNIMKDTFSCFAEDIICVMGPSICRGCFECDDDVPQMLTDAYDHYVSEYIYKKGNKWHVDLKNITYQALLKCGLSPLNISISGMCPCCTPDPDLWWSQRRCGDERGVCGAMIMMK